MACLYTVISRKEKVHTTIPKGNKALEREDMDACLGRPKPKKQQKSGQLQAYSTSGTVY